MSPQALVIAAIQSGFGAAGQPAIARATGLTRREVAQALSALILSGRVVYVDGRYRIAK